MTSETLYRSHHPRGHRNRHTPHLCPECAGPMTAGGRCSRCARPAREHPDPRFPDRGARLERMERAARR